MKVTNSCDVFFAIKSHTVRMCEKRKSRTMCENYFGAFSLATIRRAFHYVSIHKKEYRAPIQGSPIQRGKNRSTTKTGAYISATKKN